MQVEGGGLLAGIKGGLVCTGLDSLTVDASSGEVIRERREAAICVGIARVIWVLCNANIGEYLILRFRETG
jgi:hypothetical protein